MNTSDLSYPLIDLVEVKDQESLAQGWRRLEKKARGSFFTSWTWIGTWLDCLPAGTQPWLLRARRADRTVGMALVLRHRHVRLGLIPVRTWHLHETGDPKCDAVTIEYNGVLVDASEPEDLQSRMLSWLLGNTASDEVSISGTANSLEALGAEWQMQSHQHTSYQVDLAAIRTAGNDYLTALPQRQRYLVRKSLKRLGDPEPLTVHEPTTLDEARQVFGQLQALHSAHWNAKGEVGAFGHDFQRRFHQLLLERGWASGEVRLLSVRRGTEAIGHFHYFCHRGWVHYYQSGIDYELAPPSTSPGLAAHAIAIAYFLDSGMSKYDFMAGDMQYKRTLSTASTLLHWVRVQQQSPKMRLEAWALRAARLVRNRWRNRRQVTVNVATSERTTPSTPTTH